METSVDVAIIGAGTAGISAFKEASKVTDNIVMIDHGPLGTTCARVGCMPSKTIIQVANFFYERIHFSQQGIVGADQIRVDLPTAMQYIRKLRDYFTSGVIKYINSLGDHFINEEAQFLEPTVLKVGKNKIIAKKIIIATGSHSILPREWKTFSNRIVTSENFFEQENFSKKIAVIGAGLIGLELGQALSRLGIEMEAFHATEWIGQITDPVINKCAVEILKNEFPLHIQQKAHIEKSNQSLLVKTDKKECIVDGLLIAIGREPNLKKLNLEKCDITLDNSGLPSYDCTTMQIGKLPIYIAGDANKIRPLLHEAADEGRIAGYNAVRDQPHCFRRRTPLTIIFTEPNIAIVGQSYKNLHEKNFIIGEVHFNNQGRSRIMFKNQGILRIYANRSDGKLLGAEMIAPAGEHLAHIIASGIQQDMTVFDMLQMPFYHPVIQEGMRRALRELANQVTDKNKPEFELAMCDSEAIPNLC